MQYSILQNNRQELLQDYSSVGHAIEESLDRIGFHVELSTDADWGYVFRLRTKTFPVDISKIELPNGLLGVAVEVAEGVLEFHVAGKSEDAIEYGKSALSQVAEELNYLSDLEWYSDEDWRSSFGAGFWEPLE